MKKMLTFLLSLVFIIGMIPISASASIIMSAEIKNIDIPVIGAKPDFSAELENLSGVMKITKVEWVEYDADWEWQKEMTANDTFKEGYWYVVYAYLETELGHNFADSVSGTINNINAKKDGNATQANGTKVGFYVSYQAAKRLTVINKVDLTVVKPVIGKTPTFAKKDTAQYVSEKYGTVSNCSNGVTWTNQSSGVNITVSNPFKAGTKYKVTYYLTAKDGYRFDYNTKCTINGTTATLGRIDTTHITVSLSDLVPGDGKKEITSLDLSVAAPKDGEKPTYTKIEETGFYSDNGLNGTSTKIYKNGIAWYKSASSYISPGTTETFKGGTEYTVKIALTPKNGYKFAKNISAKLNSKTATVETFDDGSINVSVKLTALSKEHKHTDSSWKTDKDNHWKICTDTACGTITVAKEAHKDANKDNKCDICTYAIPAADTSKPSQTTSSKPDSNDSTQSKPTASEPDTNETQSSIATDTETDNSTPQDNTDDSELKGNEDNNSWIWIVLIAVLVLAAGAVVVFVVLKKKKAE